MKATLALGLVVAFLGFMAYVAVSAPQVSPQFVAGQAK